MCFEYSNLKMFSKLGELAMVEVLVQQQVEVWQGLAMEQPLGLGQQLVQCGQLVDGELI